MFTSCPNCLKQFRIQASQLSIADGQVQCGVCDHAFSALSRLSDVPLTLDQMRDNFAYQAEIYPSAAVKIKRQSELTTSKDAPKQEECKPAKSNQTRSDKTDILHEFPSDILGATQDVLHGGSKKKHSLPATMYWEFGALFLCVIITAQLAWFNRDELLLRYPWLDPLVREVCDRLPCEILRYRDINAIKLLNRDVRNHPTYHGKLLVNATMVNTSETTQPFPRIQLALFDSNGTVIGYREFKPEEYLDDSIHISRGMLSESPMHFVLEVGGAMKGAVSFEFHFL